MKFSNQKPPNWDKLVQLFGVEWKNVVVTYGDTVYSSRPISRDLEIHEAVHIRQQVDDVEGWWARYYEDPAFRYQEEVEAYRAQYKYFKGICKDRNEVARFRDRISRDLSSAVYGRIVTFTQAWKAVADEPVLA